MFQEVFLQYVDPLHPHVDGQGLFRLQQGRPVEGQLAVLQVAGDEQAGVGVIAVGQRDTGVGGATGGGGDARHDLERDAGGGQFLDLLATAAENERVAALQAQYAFALLGQFDQQCVELGLRHGMAVAALAHVDPLCFFPDQFHYGRGNQPVVQYNIGLLHQAQGAEREQVGVARAAADQVNLAAPQVGRFGVVEFVLQGLYGGGFTPRKQHLDHRPL